MRGEIGELVKANVRDYVAQQGSLERCGLCCVVIPTGTFSKGGMVCKDLSVSTGIAVCQIYASRPAGCRQFDCGNCKGQFERLDHLVLEALGGLKSAVYYHEYEEGYSETEAIPKAIKDMARLDLLRFSPTVLGLIEDVELTNRTAPAIWALVRPGRLGGVALPDDIVMDCLGVDTFLRNTSVAGARETLVFSRMVVANGNSSPNGLWRPVENLVARGLGLGNNAFANSNIGDLLYETG